VFAGFNALNAAEEKIIQHLIVTDQAKFIGMQIKRFLTIRIMMCFVRRFKENWKHYKSNPFEWIVDDSQSKNIQAIGTPKQ
jgi:hypothetical protein